MSKTEYPAPTGYNLPWRRPLWRCHSLEVPLSLEVSLPLDTTPKYQMPPPWDDICPGCHAFGYHSKSSDAIPMGHHLPHMFSFGGAGLLGCHQTAIGCHLHMMPSASEANPLEMPLF